MRLGFRCHPMDLCCLAERVDGLNGNNEMLSKLPHHDIIILFQNDSYLPYYRNYTREEIYMGWHDAAFQSKNYDTETYKKVQNNSYKIARRSIILLQIGIGFLIPFALTIVMGIIYASSNISDIGSNRISIRIALFNRNYICVMFRSTILGCHCICETTDRMPAFRILVKGSSRVIRSRKICESWTKCRTCRRR